MLKSPDVVRLVDLVCHSTYGKMLLRPRTPHPFGLSMKSSLQPGRLAVLRYCSCQALAQGNCYRVSASMSSKICLGLATTSRISPQCSLALPVR